MVKPSSCVALFLVTGLVAGTATGCGGAAAGKPALTVAYVASDLNRSYSLQIATGFRSGVAMVPGVRPQVVSSLAENDPVGQAEVFQRMLTTATGGISVSMSAPERFVDCLAAAADKHIPVIAVDNPPLAGTDVGLYVGNDNHELGRQLADLVIDRLAPEAHGTVLLGNPRPGVPVLDLRAVAVRAEFRKRRPDVQVLGPFDTGQRPDLSKHAWQQLLAANPHPLAVLSVGADGVLVAGVRRAAKATWLAAAFDLDSGSLAAVQHGELMLISPEHFLKGAIAGRLQAEHADHRSPLPTGWIYTAGLAVTGKNVDSIIRRQSSLAAKRTWFAADLDHIFGPDGPQLRDLSQIR
jgi:ribose transport system substrate-binding protein